MPGPPKGLGGLLLKEKASYKTDCEFISGFVFCFCLKYIMKR